MALTIMLIDDNEHDNFFHERIVKKTISDAEVIVHQKAKNALQYLEENTHKFPDYIFLDINMPGLSGWEFLEEFQQKFKDINKPCLIFMLSTSNNPDDIRKAKATPLLKGFETKPLTIEKLNKIIA